MKDLYRIFTILLQTYGPQHWWPARTPFEVMVGAVLTQNTAWSNVEKAIANFGPNLTPKFIAAASHGDLAAIIRPSGYYAQKAIRLTALVDWFARYDWDLNRVAQEDSDKLRSELLAVKGIGYETADSILLYAFNRPFFVVDAYTRRLFSRLGYDLTAGYDDLRQEIEANLPRDVHVYNEFHALIVTHGKQCCRKQPACGDCPVQELCQYRRGCRYLA